MQDKDTTTTTTGETADTLRNVGSWVITIVVFCVAYLAFDHFFKIMQGVPTTRAGRPTWTARPVQPSQKALGIEVEPGPDGLRVDNVLPGGAGEKAGIKVDDLLIQVGETSLVPAEGAEGEDQDTSRRLLDALDGVPKGGTISLRVQRDGQELTITITIDSAVSFERGLCEELIESAVKELREQRLEQGLWPHYSAGDSGALRPSAATTALVAYALRRAGPAGAELHQEAIEALKPYVKNGGLTEYPGNPYPHRVYGTSLYLLALAGLPEHEQRVQELGEWLVQAQVQEAHGFDAYDSRYGGWSYYETYDRNLRTDISTARHALVALDAAEFPKEHAVFQRAHLLLEECQNRTLVGPEELHEAQRALRDGGFAFAPRNSKAGARQIGDELLVYRSYGSATADGLLSLLAADRQDFSEHLEPELPLALADDTRDALRWLVDHYDLEFNPGFEDSRRAWRRGVYLYYLAALAEGLHKSGVWSLSVRGSERLWAAELVRGLRQHYNNEGRTWIGSESLMHENSPTVAASFVVIALAAARDRMAVDGGAVLESQGRPQPAVEAEIAAVGEASDWERGRQVFEARGCVGCHVQGGSGNGPDLSGIGATYLARAGRDRAQAAGRLARYLENPGAVGPLGPDTPLTMQSARVLGVTDDELPALVEYLLAQ